DANLPSTRSKAENRDCDHHRAPRSKFVQQMRQIKIQRLRSMNCFSKTRREFAHDELLEKATLKNDTADNPQKKDSQRSDPRPPARPRTVAVRLRRMPPASPLKQRNARQQKCINNRSLDQHCDREQRKDGNAIPRLPRFFPLNFLPNQ